MFLRGAFEYLAVTGEEKAVERCILARGEKKEGLHCDHMCPGCPVSLGSGARKTPWKWGSCDCVVDDEGNIFGEEKERGKVLQAEGKAT